MLTLHACWIDYVALSTWPYRAIHEIHTQEEIFVAQLAPSLVFQYWKSLIQIERLLVNNQHQLN